MHSFIKMYNGYSALDLGGAYVIEQLGLLTWFRIVQPDFLKS